jgi:hypothetical protein
MAVDQVDYVMAIGGLLEGSVCVFTDRCDYDSIKVSNVTGEAEMEAKVQIEKPSKFDCETWWANHLLESAIVEEKADIVREIKAIGEDRLYLLLSDTIQDLVEKSIVTLGDKSLAVLSELQQIIADKENKI